jgi:hypothetical protein
MHKHMNETLSLCNSCAQMKSIHDMKKHERWTQKLGCKIILQPNWRVLFVAQHIYNTHGEVVHGSFLTIFHKVYYLKNILEFFSKYSLSMEIANEWISSIKNETSSSLCNGYVSHYIYSCIHPKHEKLHPSENFHSMNICHLHIGQWEPKFYPQVQILHICVVSSLWVELKTKMENFVHRSES